MAEVKFLELQMSGKNRSRSNLQLLQPIPHASSGLTVTYRRITELKPDPANPRRHSKKQIRQIARSIKAFGFNVPILLDREDNVVAGHGRLAACVELGWTEVPTLCLDHLSAAQVRAFRIADNRLSEIATWDDRLLAEQLKDLSLLGLDLNLKLTGFEMGEIDLRIASLEDPPEQEDDPADLLAELPGDPPLAGSGMYGVSATIACCAPMPSIPRLSPRCWARNVPRWCSSIHRTMCRSPVVRAALVRSTIARSRWPRRDRQHAIHRLPGPAFRNLTAFSIDGSLHYVAWTGVISGNSGRRARGV